MAPAGRLPVEQPLGNSAEAAMQAANDQHQNDAECEAVEPIHQAAMARNDITAVLDAKTPLYGALSQIAQLPQNADRGRKDQADPPWRIRKQEPDEEPRTSAKRQPAQGSGPGLGRRNSRRELFPANLTP